MGSVKRKKAPAALSVVSLFSGCGGLDLGFEGDFEVFGKEYERLPFNITWANDLNPAACRSYKKNLADRIHCGDVWEALNTLPEHADVVIGGFPCQDLSVAGKRAGLGGARSGLFWEVVRIAKETQAKYLILENVPGLLSSQNGRDFAVVLTALQDIGFVRIAWRILDAQFFGVPQRRRRVFIVATLGDGGASPSEILDLAQGRAGYLEASQQKGKDVAGEVAEGVGDGCFTSSSFGNYQEGIGTLRANGGDLGGGARHCWRSLCP